MAGGNDQAELENPDVSEEALEQQQVAQESNQAAQANSKDVLHHSSSPVETSTSQHGPPASSPDRKWRDRVLSSNTTSRPLPTPVSWLLKGTTSKERLHLLQEAPGFLPCTPISGPSGCCSLRYCHLYELPISSSWGHMVTINIAHQGCHKTDTGRTQPAHSHVPLESLLDRKPRCGFRSCSLH